ncbi:MAG: hypothetical protein WBQ53_15695 [Methylocystis sp.]|jgi:hypothetical protein
MKFSALTLMLALCAATSPVNADIPPPPVAPKAIAAFADDQPDCFEWTDGCTICKKQADKSVACSTVGAACVQTAPLCSRRKAAP